MVYASLHVCPFLFIWCCYELHTYLFSRNWLNVWEYPNRTHMKSKLKVLKLLTCLHRLIMLLVWTGYSYANHKDYMYLITLFCNMSTRYIRMYVWNKMTSSQMRWIVKPPNYGLTFTTKTTALANYVNTSKLFLRNSCMYNLIKGYILQLHCLFCGINPNTTNYHAVLCYFFKEVTCMVL